MIKKLFGKGGAEQLTTKIIAGLLTVYGLALIAQGATGFAVV